jgi:hypothetical protein
VTPRPEIVRVFCSGCGCFVADGDVIEHEAHAWHNCGHGEWDCCGPIVTAAELLSMWDDAREEVERLSSQLATMGVPLPEAES